MTRKTGLRETIRVLLVDDEVEFSDVVSKRLARRGLEVSVAADGPEAYSALEAGGYDVVVLDVKLPGVDGVQILKAIKKRFRRVEVILYTGACDMKMAARSMAAGAFDLLLKPSGTEVLLARIKDAFRARQHRSGGSVSHYAAI